MPEPIPLPMQFTRHEIENWVRADEIKSGQNTFRTKLVAALDPYVTPKFKSVTSAFDSAMESQRFWENVPIDLVIIKEIVHQKSQDISKTSIESFTDHERDIIALDALLHIGQEQKDSKNTILLQRLANRVQNTEAFGAPEDWLTSAAVVVERDGWSIYKERKIQAKQKIIEQLLNIPRLNTEKLLDIYTIYKDILYPNHSKQNVFKHQSIHRELDATVDHLPDELVALYPLSEKSQEQMAESLDYVLLVYYAKLLRMPIANLISQASLTYALFTALHPLGDGNGLIASALIDTAFIKHGLRPIETWNKNPTEQPIREFTEWTFGKTQNLEKWFQREGVESMPVNSFLFALQTDDHEILQSLVTVEQMPLWTNGASAATLHDIRSLTGRYIAFLELAKDNHYQSDIESIVAGAENTKKALLILLQGIDGSKQSIRIGTLLKESYQLNTLLLDNAASEMVLNPNASWILARLFSNVQSNVSDLSPTFSIQPDIVIFPTIVHTTNETAIVFANNGPSIQPEIFERLGESGNSTKHTDVQKNRGVGLAGCANEAGEYGLTAVALQWDSTHFHLRDMTHKKSIKIAFEEIHKLNNPLLMQLALSLKKQSVWLTHHTAHKPIQTAFALVGDNAHIRI